jgi:hypothetical protein
MKPVPLLDDHALALTSYLEALFRGNPDNQQIPAVGDNQTTAVIQNISTSDKGVSVPETVRLEDASPDIPEWAARPFQSLLVEISGTTYALPLVAISGIGKLPDTIQQLPGFAPWEVGIFAGRNGPVRVVEPSKLGMASNLCQPDNCHVNSPRGQWLVFVGEGRWGLRCDLLKEIVILEKTQIRWRRAHGGYPWLAGTVKPHLWTLINMGALVERLVKGIGHGGKFAH